VKFSHLISSPLYNVSWTSGTGRGHWVLDEIDFGRFVKRTAR
jgi:hypothetical protein